MGHTYSNLLVHVVFSTKERRNQLNKSMRPELYKYLCGIAHNEGFRIIKVNGVEDHVHLLMSLKTTMASADVIRVLKANSLAWIHEHFPGMDDFSWQRGYAVFSVSESVAPKIVDYIEKQEIHHARMSYEHELKRLLVKHGVEFNPKYYLD